MTLLLVATGCSSGGANSTGSSTGSSGAAATGGSSSGGITSSSSSGSTSGTSGSGGSTSGSSGGSEASYTYPGCPLQDGQCPRQGTLQCALDTIRAKYDGCTQSSDCEAFDATAGHCVETCPVAISVSNQSTYQAEVVTELQTYCANPTCGSHGSCASTRTPICFQGTCQFPDLPDGGV